MSPDQRRSLYNAGRCCFTTPRILQIDLLTDKVRAGALAGCFICSAKDLSRDSPIEYAVRLFLRGQPGGFVRFIEENPASFEAGFSKVLSCSVRHLSQMCEI